MGRIIRKQHNGIFYSYVCIYDFYHFMITSEDVYNINYFDYFSGKVCAKFKIKVNQCSK